MKLRITGIFGSIFVSHIKQVIPAPKAMFWVDLVLFKISWIMLVVFQAQAIVPAMGIILLKVMTWPDIHKSLNIIVTTLVIGLIMDFILTATGVFVFPDYNMPLWLVLLWVSFAMTLPRGFSFIAKLHPMIQACTGMLAGSVGYFAGYLLGAVAFGFSLSLSLIFIGLLWSGFIPLLFWLEKYAAREVKNAS